MPLATGKRPVYPARSCGVPGAPWLRTMAGNGPAPAGVYSVAASVIVLSPNSPFTANGTLTSVCASAAAGATRRNNRSRTRTQRF
jgi:hypothetical protein